MPRVWAVMACPVCSELALPHEAEGGDLKCNGLPEGERHKLTTMVEVTVKEVETS